MDLVNRASLMAALSACLCVSSTFAAGLSLKFGNAVAAQDYRYKTAAFVFRLDGCDDLSKAQISGTAEGIESGARRSLPLQFRQAGSGGVYSVISAIPNTGAWVVSLTAGCAGETTGALVPIGPAGLIREGVKTMPRSPTAKEADAALKELVASRKNDQAPR
jgi:hypothetical protein